MLISLIGTGRLPADIAAEEDFTDPLLKSLYAGLKSGASPAALAEEEEREDTRARVSRLLLTPPSEDTDQLIRMAQDCLFSMRRRRLEEKLKTIMRTINTLSGEEKQAALAQVQSLSAKLQRLKNNG